MNGDSANICSVENCGRAIINAKRGLCGLHYQRWWHNGTTKRRCTAHEAGRMGGMATQRLRRAGLAKAVVPLKKGGKKGER